MYVVTFYSFKGGVGRTLALVNIGAELATKGRNVLLVDLDLEAPGIPTFHLFANLTDTPGIVEYVSEYLSTSRAPDVKHFITRCTTRESLTGGGLWLMPAGRQDTSYAARFHAIDWQDLYANREGFLMFEDLKEQWRSAITGGFDYVLIDSRTGHTDVAGICTRQLPEAVVIMFYPNEQNLSGLGKVVTDIRGEHTSPRQKRIELHFTASNVPDLDDEENILNMQLERSRHILNCEEDQINILHHYNSLALLKQEIFVLERPKSRLSREYLSLLNAIISANPQDREGAINTLGKVQAAISRLPHESNLLLGDAEAKLSEIARLHGHDGDILYRIAALTERLGKPEDALSMLEDATQAGVTSPQIYARRAHLYRILGRTADAVSDALRVLGTSEKVAPVDVLGSLRVIIAYGRGSLPTIDSLPAIYKLEVDARLRIAKELMTTVEGLPAAERLLRGIVNDSSASDELKSGTQNPLELCLIAQEKYDEAMTSIAKNRPTIHESMGIRDIFNYAIAEWGKTLSSPHDLFSQVVQLSKSQKEQGLNYLQCMAISHFCVSDLENADKYVTQALREIRIRPSSTFSAWRYLEISPSEFRKDLMSMKQKMVSGEKFVPLFFGRSRDLLSAVH
jgi:MinD-like ATPase involved in chromosome partitioning or flagellar assembly